MARSTDPDVLARQIETLDDQVNRLRSQMAGFVTPTGAHEFYSVKANQMDLKYGPSGGLVLISSNAQSINNDTVTILSWSSKGTTSTPTPQIFFPQPVGWSSVVSSQIQLPGVSYEHIFQIFGHVQFAANSSGFREVGINGYYSGPPTIGDTINKIPAVASAGVITSVPFAGRMILRASSAVSELPLYYGLYVKQDSGAALNVIYAQATIWRIF